MSCKIATGTTAESVKDLADLKVGTSGSSSKDVNKVLKWDGTILWQRKTTKQLTSGNTDFAIYKTSYSYKNDLGYCTYDCKPYVYNTDTSEAQKIKYYDGSNWIELIQGRDFTVTYSDNSSGRLPSSGTTKVSDSIIATLFVNGIGDYSGTVERQFTITYTYEEGTKYYYVHATADPAGSGTFTGTTDRIAEYSPATVTATAGSGYVFKRWNDGTTANPKQITYVTGNIDLIGTFKRGPFSVTASASPTTAGTVSGGGNNFAEGDSCTLTATVLDTDYNFQKWSDGTTESTNASWTFTIGTSNVTAVATFVEKPSIVSCYVSCSKGSGTKTSKKSYEANLPSGYSPQMRTPCFIDESFYGFITVVDSNGDAYVVNSQRDRGISVTAYNYEQIQTDLPVNRFDPSASSYSTITHRKLLLSSNGSYYKATSDGSKRCHFKESYREYDLDGYYLMKA